MDRPSSPPSFRGRRLSSLFSTASPSNVSELTGGLNDLGLTSKLTVRTAEAQKKGAAQLNKWAHDGQNAAIADVMKHTNELMRVYADKQIEFSREFERHLQQLQKITDCDMAVHKAERNLQTIVEREAKLSKELKKSSFWRKGGDECLMRHELVELGHSKAAAERALSDTKAEMEVVKMFHFRHGMQGIADAYRNLSLNTSAIFDCHREITELVPAISTQDVRRMVYDGSSVTRRRVDELRHRLGLDTVTEMTPRRRSEPAARSSNRHRGHGTPPPPYSPPTYSENASVNLVTSRPTWTASPQNHRMAASLSCSSCGNSNNIYPRLPPNPYAKQIKSLTP